MMPKMYKNNSTSNTCRSAMDTKMNSFRKMRSKLENISEKTVSICMDTSFRIEVIEQI